MQYYDITVAAFGRQIVEAPGNFIYYLAGNAGGADNTIKVTLGLGGTSVLLKPGQSMRLPADAKPIDLWRIENNANAATILGSVLVGKGDFKDSNVTGTVQVMDGGKARTLGGGAFMGYVSSSTTQAANRPVVHYRNPTGSGKNSIVESIVVSSSVAGFIGWGYQVAALTTNIGPVASKLATGAAGVTNMSRDEITTYPYATNIGGINVAAGGSVVLPLKEPIILPPNTGLGISLSTVGAGNLLTATLEIVEESQ